MGMKQILAMMVALVGLSVMADEVVITDPVLKEALCKQLKKPYGKFAPPMKLTEAELQKLEDLFLGKTKVTDEGLKDVAKLQKLTLLGLTNTQITDEGLKEVAKLQKLEELVLENTKVTDDGIKKNLTNLQNLTSIFLRDTQITCLLYTSPSPRD